MSAIVYKTFISIAILTSLYSSILAFIVKGRLEKFGYKVTYMNPSITDFKNLNKLRKKNSAQEPLYYASVLAIAASLIGIILFILCMILD